MTPPAVDGEPGVLCTPADGEPAGVLVPFGGEALPDEDAVAVLVAVFVAVAGPEELAAADRFPHGLAVGRLAGLLLSLGCAEAVAVAVPRALPVPAGFAVPAGLVADDCGAALGLVGAPDVAVPDGLAFGDAAWDEAALVFGASGERGADGEHEADAAELECAVPSATPDAPLPMAWPGPLPRGAAPPPVELLPGNAAATPVTSTERSGGTASATPMANSAHATPSAGRSSA